jgi:L-aspartate oxidase
MEDIVTNTLIIGCGIAGGAAALRLSDDPGQHVTLITRTQDAAISSSSWAQGGIVTGGLDDSPDLLVEDILRAGAGLSLPRTAHLWRRTGAYAPF